MILRLRPRIEALGTVGLFADQGTSVLGLTWSISRCYWGRDLMGEAAPAVVDHLLAQPGIDRVEAWIDARNTRSRGVARRAGLLADCFWSVLTLADCYGVDPEPAFSSTMDDINGWLDEQDQSSKT